MDQKRRPYPSDLTLEQWETIKGLVPKPRSGGRRRTTDVREVINAILYIVRTGGAWRYLPKEFPPWKTVYDYFYRFSQSGVWSRINQVLCESLREKLNKAPTPTLAIVDSQSVRAHYGEARGWDGFKKVRGRKRHVIVDTMGLLLGCAVHRANERDPHGGVRVLEKLPLSVLKSVTKILGDGAYVGPFDDIAHFNYGIAVERASSSKERSNLKPKRWIVERTIAWFNHFRRLSRDYERRTIYSEAMIYISMIALTLRRLSS